jgi:hypothetical protein
MSIHRKIFFMLNAAVGIFAIAACGDDPNALNGRRNTPGADGNGDGVTPEALQCTAKPEGRPYTLFDGTKLHENRVNENVGVNRARFKPYAVMASEYQRVLGVPAPKGLAGAGASFDDPPARWFSESSHSGVSLNAIFDISFEACSASTALPAEMPTDESAKQYCTTTMRKAWSQSPSPEELAGCVDLATKKLATEPAAKRRWSYVCASILSSSHFLTF